MPKSQFNQRTEIKLVSEDEQESQGEVEEARKEEGEKSRSGKRSRMRMKRVEVEEVQTGEAAFEIHVSNRKHNTLVKHMYW